MNPRSLIRVLSLMAATIELVVLPVSRANAQNVTLPPPDSGSFATTFDFIPDGRLVTFSGFNVRLQTQPDSSEFKQLGTLPEEFLGGSEPAFVISSPNGLFFLLGTGAGGSKSPNPPFNGSIFVLTRTGGQPTLVANIPFHYAGTFRRLDEVLINRGEGNFSKATVVNLSLRTKKVQPVINNIPGAAAGVAADRFGNVYTGIGFDRNGPRTGEIRRFLRQDVNRALRTGVPLEFDSDGKFVAKVLSAGSLVFDLEGDLWVGGGDVLGGGQQGFIAEVDPRTGKVLRRIDPTDGNPDGGPKVFFSVAITRPFSCTLGAVNYYDPNRTLYKINACQTLPPP